MRPAHFRIKSQFIAGDIVGPFTEPFLAVQAETFFANKLRQISAGVETYAKQRLRWDGDVSDMRNVCHVGGVNQIYGDEVKVAGTK
jgi:hypothetical protein